MTQNNFLKGTLILMCSGLISRFIGFFYRIFLSRSIGAQGMGIYQLVIPLQILILALSTSGIQIAISRTVASRLALKKHKEAREFFFLGTGIAFLISLLLTLFIYHNALFFADQLLKEPRTYPLIRLLSVSFPLSTLHACINSYYFARKKTEIPSLLQLIEQGIRVGTCYLLFYLFSSEGRELTPIIAIGGTLASEIAACIAASFFLFSDFQKYPQKFFPVSDIKIKTQEILSLSVPLTLNRVLLTLLNSMESVLIPQRLILFGSSSRDALCIYGIFTGMVLPLLLFPATVTNSASVMLMPSIAELQAQGYQKRIRFVTFRACFLCIVFGGICSIGFYFFGSPLGNILFSSPTAGIYIRTMAFVCPFLYMNTALASILHGLGKTGICLIHNVIGLSIRILFVLFMIPFQGMQGYFYGIMLCESLLSILHIRALLH